MTKKSKKLLKILFFWINILFLNITFLGLFFTIKNIKFMDQLNARTFVLADDRTDSSTKLSPHIKWGPFFKEDFKQYILNSQSPEHQKLAKQIKDYDIQFSYQPGYESNTKFQNAIQEGKNGMKLLPSLIFQYGDNFYNFLNNLRKSKYPVGVPDNLESFFNKKDEIYEGFKKSVEFNTWKSSKEVTMIPVGKSFSNYLFINKLLLAEILIILGKEDLAFGSKKDYSTIKNNAEDQSFLFQSNAKQQPGKFTKYDIPTIEKVKKVIDEENKKKLEGYTWSFEDKKDFVEQIVLSKRKDQYYIENDNIQINKYRTFFTHTESNVVYDGKKEIITEKWNVIPWGVMDDSFINKNFSKKEKETIKNLKSFNDLINIFSDIDKFQEFSNLLPKIYMFQKLFIKKFRENFDFDIETKKYKSKKDQELYDSEEIQDLFNKEKNEEWIKDPNFNLYDKDDFFRKHYQENAKNPHASFFNLGNDNIEKSLYLQYANFLEDDFLFKQKIYKDRDYDDFTFNLKGSDNLERFVKSIDKYKKLNIANEVSSKTWPDRWGSLYLRNLQRSGQSYSSDYFHKGRQLASLSTTGGFFAFYKEHTRDFNSIWLKPEMIFDYNQKGKKPRGLISGPGLAILKKDETSLSAYWNKLNSIKNQLSLEFAKFTTQPDNNKKVAHWTSYFPIHKENFDPKPEVDLSVFYEHASELDKPGFAEVARQIKKLGDDFIWDLPASSLGNELKTIFNQLFNDYYVDNLDIGDGKKRNKRDKGGYNYYDFIQAFKHKIEQEKKAYNLNIYWN